MQLSPVGGATYTAQWAINHYTAIFDSNDGSEETRKTQVYGTSLVAPTVAREGYTFTGWQPEVPSTMPDFNNRYVAQWTANNYLITFDANGGEGGWSELRAYGSSITAPIVTKTGYAFTEWQPSIDETVPLDGATYVAQWQIKKYVVTFVVDTSKGQVASGNLVQQVEYGQSATAPIVQAKSGWAFNGWDKMFSNIVANTTITAQFSETQPQ